MQGATQEQHDERLRKVMMRLRKRGLTLNLENCQFSMNELTFMGHVLSSRGVGVAADKVKAVVDAREPESVSEVRSFSRSGELQWKIYSRSRNSLRTASKVDEKGC